MAAGASPVPGPPPEVDARNHHPEGEKERRQLQHPELEPDHHEEVPNDPAARRDRHSPVHGVRHRRHSRATHVTVGKFVD